MDAQVKLSEAKAKAREKREYEENLQSDEKKAKLEEVPPVKEEPPAAGNSVKITAMGAPVITLNNRTMKAKKLAAPIGMKPLHEYWQQPKGVYNMIKNILSENPSSILVKTEREAALEQLKKFKLKLMKEEEADDLHPSVFDRALDTSSSELPDLIIPRGSRTPEPAKTDVRPVPKFFSPPARLPTSPSDISPIFGLYEESLGSDGNKTMTTAALTSTMVSGEAEVGNTAATIKDGPDFCGQLKSKVDKLSRVVASLKNGWGGYPTRGIATLRSDLTSTVHHHLVSQPHCHMAPSACQPIYQVPAASCSAQHGLVSQHGYAPSSEDFSRARWDYSREVTSKQRSSGTITSAESRASKVRRAVARVSLRSEVKPWDRVEEQNVFTTSSEEDQATLNSYAEPEPVPRIKVLRKKKKKGGKE